MKDRLYRLLESQIIGNLYSYGISSDRKCGFFFFSSCCSQLDSNLYHANEAHSIQSKLDTSCLCSSNTISPTSKRHFLNSISHLKNQNDFVVRSFFVLFRSCFMNGIHRFGLSLCISWHPECYVYVHSAHHTSIIGDTMCVFFLSLYPNAIANVPAKIQAFYGIFFWNRIFFSLPTTNLCTGDTEKYIYIYNGNIYEERKEKKSSEWNFWLILMVNDRQPTKQTVTQKYSRRFFDAEHFSNDRELIFFPSHFFRSSRMVNNKWQQTIHWRYEGKWFSIS